jgi:hypothetical protein
VDHQRRVGSSASQEVTGAKQAPGAEASRGCPTTYDPAYWDRVKSPSRARIARSSGALARGLAVDAGHEEFKDALQEA